MGADGQDENKQLCDCKPAMCWTSWDAMWRQIDLNFEVSLFL